MDWTWEAVFRAGHGKDRAAQIMRCSRRTAGIELERVSRRLGAQNAYLRHGREKKTALENSAYAGVAEWGSRARVPLSDRLPNLVGMNDRASQVPADPNADCSIPLSTSVLSSKPQS
jgi:hypothetical protein